MRKLCTVVAGLLAVGAWAIPAAAARPPSAIDQVKKLVKAGMCTNAEVVDPTETVARCLIAQPVYVEVHAFPTAKKMRADLAGAVTDDCAGSLPGSTVRYRVGPTWWVHPYTGENAATIKRVLGGTLKSYPCRT